MSTHAANIEPSRRAARRALGTRFDHEDEDPRASLVNLVDVMLVFACGLLAAIGAAAQRAPVEVERGRVIDRPVQGRSAAGAGYRAVGQVFRDPKTGRMILVEDAPQAKPR